MYLPKKMTFNERRYTLKKGRQATVLSTSFYTKKILLIKLKLLMRMNTHSNILTTLWLFKITVKIRHLYVLKKNGHTRITFILVEYSSGLRKKY